MYEAMIKMEINYTKEDYDREKLQEYIHETISAEQDMFAPDFVRQMSNDDLWNFINHYNLLQELETFNDNITHESISDFIIDGYIDDFLEYYSDEFHEEFQCYQECR